MTSAWWLIGEPLKAAQVPAGLVLIKVGTGFQTYWFGILFVLNTGQFLKIPDWMISDPKYFRALD